MIMSKKCIAAGARCFSRRTLRLVAALLGIATPAIALHADEAQVAAQIDRLVQPYLDEPVVVGMVVGAIRGDLSLVRGYGKIDRDQPAAPDGQTVYEIGSVSKTFTGLLLAEAVIDGRVRLDQPISELLPIDLPQHPDGPIVLKHLATHTSGLPRLPDNMDSADGNDPYAEYALDDLHAFLTAHQPARGPGKKQEYSNLAFGLLGEILAKQAGLSYGDLLQTEIADPLGMRDTAVQLTDAMRSRLATPHDEGLSKGHLWNFQAIAGAGAIRSTVDDMLKYARAHLQPPDGQLGEAIELAWRVHQPAVSQDGFAMGLGWHVARDGATRWHNGQTGGYHSMVLINREANAAVVVLANTATGEIDVLAEQLLRMLLGAAEKPRLFEKSVKVPSEQMQRLAGRYQLAPDFILTVRVEGDALMVGATGQSFARVYPKSPTEWEYRVVNASLTFEGEQDAPATAVVLHQNGLDQRAERID